MAYCDEDQVKIYLGIAEDTDDALIVPLINRAQKFIEDYCHRKFEASADTTRKFDVEKDTAGATLYFDEDICSIATVTNNADGGVYAETILNTEYVTLPRNYTPYHAIRILSSADHFWTYTDDPEMGITVAGKWAYSLTAPLDIQQACIRYASYLYRQKDSQVFDTTADAMTGMVTIPQRIPTDVKIVLDMYRKIV